MKRISHRLFIPALALSVSGFIPGCDDEDGGDDESMIAGTQGEESSNDAGGGGGGGGGEGGTNDGDGGDVDNVAACEDLVGSLECGGMDLGMYVDCSSYASLSCDLADYLMCLEDEFVCTDGVFDASGWAGCASLASCE